jgi:hypothetical protein
MSGIYAVIKNKAGVDTNLVSGLTDEWSVDQINIARNSLKALASLKHQQYFNMTRDAYVQSASEILAPGHGLPVEIDWSWLQPAGTASMTARVRCLLKTDNVATSVTGYIKRITGTVANIITFGPYNTTTAWTVQSPVAFPSTETGVQQYEFYLKGSDALYGVRGMAVAEIYVTP